MYNAVIFQLKGSELKAIKLSSAAMGESSRSSSDRHRVGLRLDYWEVFCWVVCRCGVMGKLGEEIRKEKEGEEKIPRQVVVSFPF